MRSQIFHRNEVIGPGRSHSKQKQSRRSMDWLSSTLKFAIPVKKHMRRCSDGMIISQNSLTIKNKQNLKHQYSSKRLHQKYQPYNNHSQSKLLANNSKQSIQFLTAKHTCNATPKASPRNSGKQSPNHTAKQSFNVTAKQSWNASAKQSWNASKNNSPEKKSKGPTTRHQYKNKIEQYKFFYQIGFGAFGRVWKVMQREGGRQLALKQISKAKVVEKCNVNSIINERIILSRLNNSFLINIVRAFQSQSNLYLIMDYLRGADLRYHICYQQGFSQAQIKFIAGCMVIAVQYIHQKGIIHRDLKPENIVFQQGGYARLTDFGIAQFHHTQYQKGEFSGTPVYMAPEILFKGKYSFESDFYSLGIIIYELAMGKRPYNGKNRNQIRQELMGREVCLGEFDRPSHFSQELASLINGLLKKNPSQRLGFKGASEIKNHPFFKGMCWQKLAKKELKPLFIPHVVCETKSYLNEIAMFNQMNGQNAENQAQVSPEHNLKFKEYDFQGQQHSKKNRPGGQLKKMKRGSRMKFYRD